MVKTINLHKVSTAALQGRAAAGRLAAGIIREAIPDLR
jgi:hypothetical protein